ncbi:uncharacterized protein METZ01_LOCUS182330, partial [marine metagenome]
VNLKYGRRSIKHKGWTPRVFKGIILVDLRQVAKKDI